MLGKILLFCRQLLFMSLSELTFFPNGPKFILQKDQLIFKNAVFRKNWKIPVIMLVAFWLSHIAFFCKYIYEQQNSIIDATQFILVVNCTSNTAYQINYETKREIRSIL